MKTRYSAVTLLSLYVLSFTCACSVVRGHERDFEPGSAAILAVLDSVAECIGNKTGCSLAIDLPTGGSFFEATESEHRYEARIAGCIASAVERKEFFLVTEEDVYASGQVHVSVWLDKEPGCMPISLLFDPLERPVSRVFFAVRSDF